MKIKRSLGLGNFSLVINFLFIVSLLVYCKGQRLVSLLPSPFQTFVTILLICSLFVSIYLCRKYPHNLSTEIGKRLSLLFLCLFLLGLLFHVFIEIFF
ncbi:hypothetical protein A5816_001541 [Enterococcus sp. 3G1_DIV0629]|nr:hypothetical protein A5816_001541 [Enterococcus sp. 3G1_DIV0629]